MTREPSIVSQAEVVETANGLLRAHGRDALIIAELAAEDLKARGDEHGYTVMKRVLLVVDEMFAEEPPGTMEVH